MSLMEPSLQRDVFHAAMAESEATEGGRGEHVLSAVVLATLLIDVLVVTAAFLLAYWVRFIVPDDEASALGLHEYARTGALVGLATVVLFAIQGIYDRRRRLPWPSRLHVVVSAISTAL